MDIGGLEFRSCYDGTIGKPQGISIRYLRSCRIFNMFRSNLL